MKRPVDEILALLTDHGARLHALLLRLTLRTDVAEDLMQDLFCKLGQSDRFAAATNPLAYALRVATNLGFDYRRKQRRTTRSENDTNQLAVMSPSPLMDMVRREEFDQVLDAVSRLPRGSRELIVLRFLERQDYKTIGGQLGKTPHQVRALCHKAIVRLRVALDAERAKKPIAVRPVK